MCSKTDLRVEVLRLLEAAPDALLEHPLRRMIAFKERFAGARAVVALTEAGPPFASHRELADRLRA